MATHANSTRMPLLPPADAPPPLLGCGSCRQPGPVTVALAAMHAADPDRQRILRLRRAIADRIEADIALLDALDGDPDLDAEHDGREPGEDAEPSLCGLTVGCPGGVGDDREHDSADDEIGLQPLHMGGGGFAITSFGRAA